MILEDDAPQAPQAIIRFYFWLEAWRRDIENIAAESQRNNEDVTAKEVRFLAKRAHQTLLPGLRALQALAPMVDGYEQLEADAIAGYDVILDVPRRGSLRERIRRLINVKEPSIG